MQKRKIPVFYHIPKNAGTYVSDWMLIAFRYYRKTYTDWLKTHSEDRDSIKIIQLLKDNLIVSRLLIGDPNYNLDSKKSSFFNKHNVTRWDINIDNIPLNFFNDLFVFGIIIEANGFKIKQDILNLLQNYETYDFLILRDPFSRAQSIYNYNTSKESLHDYSHGKIKSKTFQDYITSFEIEDSWLTRTLLNLKDCEQINEDHYKDVLDVLKDFSVYSIKEVDKAVQWTFRECYQIDIKQFKLAQWDTVAKNQTKKEKIKFEELPLHVQQAFEQRTYWDIKLYKALLNE